jgi:4-diphosphocytidyl-2-C-methyl-D-erythritol kinase
VKPEFGINTKEAFEGIIPAKPEISIIEIISKPIKAWKDELKNDFEKIIFLKYPEIAKIKNDLYNSGAIYVSMSGSGSAVYGIFSKKQSVTISFPPKYFVRELIG